MECPHCHYPVPDGARCCAECGFIFGSPVDPRPKIVPQPSPAVEPKPEPKPIDEIPPARVVKLEHQDWGKGLFDLAVDTLAPFLSEDNNSIRILFVANRDSIEKVEIAIDPQDGECTKTLVSFDVPGDVPSAGFEHECLFGIKKLPSGRIPCDIRVNIVADGISSCFAGSFEMPVTTSKEVDAQAQKNIEFHFQNSFNNTIDSNVSPGSDSRINIEGIKNLMGQEIGKLIEDRKPQKAIEELVGSGARSYRRIRIVPKRNCKPVPVEASSPHATAKEIQIEFGSAHRRHTVQFFTDDEICIGHSVDGERLSDVIVDAPEDQDGASAAPYGRISRRHCMLFREGGEVKIRDGYQLNNGSHRESGKSTNGTFLQGEQINELVPFVDGDLKLGSVRDAVTLNVKAVRSTGCDRCPIAPSNRTTCADGACPCILISRKDSLDLRYVVLWGCFDLGEIDRNFKGVEIFSYEGGFAWRRGALSGWLENGADFGLSHYGGITVSTVWSDQ